jgi:hypothetical protein
VVREPHRVPFRCCRIRALSEAAWQRGVKRVGRRVR